MSPTKKLSFSASGGRRVAIAGLPESDAYVEQPWQRLFDTVHLLAKPLGWDMENLLNNTRYRKYEVPPTIHGGEFHLYTCKLVTL